MKLYEFGGVRFLSDVEAMDIIPKCYIDAGYFTDFTNFLRMETLRFYPIKFETATLTIEPYYLNREFGIIYGCCMNDEFIDFAGGCTQLCVVKFTGSSLDALRRTLMSVQRTCLQRSLANGTDVNKEISDYMDTVCIEASMERDVTRYGNKYYSCVFDLVPSEYPEFISSLRSSRVLRKIEEPTSLKNAKFMAASSSSSPSPSALRAPKPPRSAAAEQNEEHDEPYMLF